jgi:hypothetical protein
MKEKDHTFVVIAGLFRETAISPWDVYNCINMKDAWQLFDAIICWLGSTALYHHL